MKTNFRTTFRKLGAMCSLGLISFTSYSQYAVSTFAGTGVLGNSNGTNAASTFNFPYGLAVDNLNNVYVTDLSTGDGVTSHYDVRMISNGNVSKIGGTYFDAAGPGAPAGLAFSAGNLFVADSWRQRIAKIATTDLTVVNTIAGSLGLNGYVNGIGAAARFSSPYGIAIGPDGFIYIGDTYNNVIRRIATDGTVSTFATGFNLPMAMVFNAAGDLFVSNLGAHNILKVTPAGVVSVFAGSGTPGYTDGGSAVSFFNSPRGITIDAAGNLYIGDTGNNRIRKITPAGVVSTIAGSGSASFADGNGTSASINQPSCVALDNQGNLYVADYGNHRIRKIVLTNFTTNSALTPFSSCSGIVSASQSFSVSGSNLGSNAIITAPTGFQVSLNSTTGYANSLSLAPTNGSIASTLVYVRLASTATGSPTGNITFSGTNISTPSIAVSGTVTTIPVTPTFTTAPATNVCVGPQIFTINAVAGATGYIWTADGVAQPSTTTTMTKTWIAADAGNKVVTVKASNTCGSSTTALSWTTNVAIVPSQPSTIIGTASGVCVNSSPEYNITSIAGVTYQWYLNNVALAAKYNTSYLKPDFTIVGPNTLSVKAMSSNGACLSPASSLVITTKTGPTFNIIGSGSVCPNTSGNEYHIDFPGTSPEYSYTWSIVNNATIGVNFPNIIPNTTNASITLTIPKAFTSGSFYLRCVGKNACGDGTQVDKLISIQTGLPPYPNVVCSGTSGTNTCLNLSVSNNAGSTISWKNANGSALPIATVPDPTLASITRPLSTNIICTYSNASGCTSTTSYSPGCTFNLRMEGEAEEITLPADKSFMIYPNPAKGVFVIQTKGQAGTASIYDVTGHLVKEIDLSESQNSYNVEIGTAGVYTIHVKTATEKKGYKIVIE